MASIVHEIFWLLPFVKTFNIDHTQAILLFSDSQVALNILQLIRSIMKEQNLLNWCHLIGDKIQERLLC